MVGPGVVVGAGMGFGAGVAAGAGVMVGARVDVGAGSSPHAARTDTRRMKAARNEKLCMVSDLLLKGLCGSRCAPPPVVAPPSMSEDVRQMPCAHYWRVDLTLFTLEITQGRPHPNPLLGGEGICHTPSGLLGQHLRFRQGVEHLPVRQFTSEYPFSHGEPGSMYRVLAPTPPSHSLIARAVSSGPLS